MKNHNFFYFLVVFFLVLSSSCGGFRRIQKSDDWKVKYEAALKYYETEDYYRAILLFDDILPIVKGVKEGEKVFFYYAYAHFHYRNQYILASHHFQKFYQTYSRSEFAEEANYMYAYALYLDSPKYNLDQTSSFEAIDAMQNFINKYPQSEYAVKADEIIGNLQVKLELKAYDNAKEYYKLSRYKASIIAFKNFQNDFPDSDFKEELEYLMIDAQFNLAKLSIPSKQKERYIEAIEFYENFVDKYEKSQYLKAAEGFYDKSQNQLRKLGASPITLSSNK